MPSFAGFPSRAVHSTPVPAPFFSDLLPQIDHLGELKVTLYAIWFLDQQEGPLRYLMLKDLLGDRRLVEGLVSMPAISSVPWTAPPAAEPCCAPSRPASPPRIPSFSSIRHAAAPPRNRWGAPSGRRDSKVISRPCSTSNARTFLSYTNKTLAH